MDTILAALENAADGAFVIDSNQRIVYWNHAAEALFGHAANQVLGRSCFEIIRGRDEHDHAWCRGNCHVAVGARDGETIETFNTLARTLDGETRWINVSILALPAAAAGEAALVLHLCRDATDLKRNEQIARQALALLQSWQQPVQKVFEIGMVAKRRYERHFISKLTDADGEQQETQHWLEVAFDCGYLEETELRDLLSRCERTGRLLGGMIEKAELFCGEPKTTVREPAVEYFVEGNWDEEDSDR